MLVNKITSGFVIQVFDTELKRFVSQEFVAGDHCDYEDGNGDPVSSELLKADGKDASLPFDMVQPPSEGKDEREGIQLGRDGQLAAGDAGDNRPGNP
ncbi:MAG: hypothetical protein ACLQNE_31970 [Thermoguttaceae bacterium]